MESFKFLYFEACKNFKISQCEKLLSRIEDAGNSSILNVSGFTLSKSTCLCLGQALVKDVHIKELDCSNCMLSDQSLLSILSGLEKNKFLTTLYLKGNNIRSSGTEALGKLLRHNSHLQNLLLEWNGLGILPEKFALFCEGLCMNSCLKTLDLRSNQLNHICAQFLSDAILRNSSLQNLDLRWNSFGLIGGRMILKSLAGNRSITSLDASGNFLPLEIMEAIRTATTATAERFLANNELIDRSKYLASKLEEKEQEKHIQVQTLIVQLEKKDLDAVEKKRLNTLKLTEAEKALAAKDEICESLTKRIQELESELLSKTVEKNNIELSLKSEESKNVGIRDKYQSILEKERKRKEDKEIEMQEEISFLKEENVSLKQQVKEFKIQFTQSEDHNSKFKECITKLESNLEQEQTCLKEQLLSLNKKHAEEIKEKEILHEREFSRLKEEFFEVKKSLKHKLSSLESQNDRLEQEVKEKNGQIFLERSQSEEKLIQLEKKLKSDNEKIQQQLEERIYMLEEANREQYEHLQADLRLLHQLKTDITGLDLNLAEQEHEIDHLKKLLEEKDAEMKAHENKVRLEVKEQLEELRDSKETIKKQMTEYSLLQNTIKDMQARHNTELDSKANTIEHLKSELLQLQGKLSEMAEDEKKRSHQLQKAFQVYLKPHENVSSSGDASAQ